jgi:hypothetical protein
LFKDGALNEEPATAAIQRYLDTLRWVSAAESIIRVRLEASSLPVAIVVR